MSNNISEPLLIESKDSSSISQYFKENKNDISSQLLVKGAILFRGFSTIDSATLQSLAEEYSGEMMDHSVRLTHRKHVSGKINTSTEYNPSLKILQHTENSFCSTFPQKMFFYCITKSTSGGETPLSDVSAVYDALRKETKEKFERLGVLYVRNFWPGFGPDWKAAYNVSSKEELNEYCIDNSIDIEWMEENRPRLSQKWPAVVLHPVTGKKIWFNHATTSNVASVPSGLRDIIKDGFQLEDFPNNTYYGDGSEIADDVLEEINTAYDTFEYHASWQEGDLLLVDNMRLAHGKSI